MRLQFFFFHWQVPLPVHGEERGGNAGSPRPIHPSRPCRQRRALPGSRQPAGSRAPPLSGPRRGSLGATLTTKKLKSIVSSVNRLLFFSIYLPRRSGQIFTIKSESVEHGCCTNIYISADHSLIAALGENNIPSSVTPFWRPESRSQLQSQDRRSPCLHVQSNKLISSDAGGQCMAFSSGPTVLRF